MRWKLGMILFALTVLGGCSYTTRNALPPHLKTIAIPVFGNKTYAENYTRRLEVDVTTAVRNTFIQTGELKIAGRENADLVLEGDIMRLERTVLRTDRFGDPAEMRVIIRARISVYDVKEAKYLFKEQMVSNADKNSESGAYNLRRGEYEAMSVQTAVDDLGRMIARRITERWPDSPKIEK